MVLAVNAINAGLVAALLALYLHQPRWWVFFGLVISLTAARVIGWRCYHNHRQAAGLTIRWAIIATAGSGLSGLLWGGSSILLLSENIVENTFIAFVVGGMCAGSLVSLSYYMPAFLSFTYSSVVLLAVSFFLEGRAVYVAMGCMTVVYAGALTFAAHQFNRAFVRGLRLNLDLSERTDELTQRTEELTAVNARLAAAIAQREAAEVQLHQAQKMEALGQLTGGIAHDFNNLLTVVSGNAELLHDKAQDDVAARRILAIVRAGEQGMRLTRQLLAFSRRQTLRPEPVDLRSRTHEIAEMLSRSLREDIEIAVEIPENLWTVMVDPAEFELALLNLGVNARDAMPNGGGLRVEAHNVSFRPGDVGSEGLIGDFVAMTLSDTGTGMTPEVMARAFEPFYTTKEVGEGSGLGLPQVYGFAKQSNGAAVIESEVGCGTSITLFLPRATINPIEAQPAATAVPAGAPIRILLVEDDDEVAGATVELLQDIGFYALHSRGSIAALAALDRDRTIELVMSDIVMPGGMSGLELARTLRESRPELPVVLATGYSQYALQVVKEGFPLVEKPYRRDLLAASLRAAAERSKRPGSAANLLSR
jgi:signal transduction histidine kinase/ActR/RegA family two-component response regulator